jgi:hypothetical protein
VTRDEAAVISAYTGILCGSMSDLHAYAEKVMGRSIWTHEFASEELTRELKERSRPDFIAICEQVSRSPACGPIEIISIPESTESAAGQ